MSNEKEAAVERLIQIYGEEMRQDTLVYCYQHRKMSGKILNTQLAYFQYGVSLHFISLFFAILPYCETS